MALSEVTQSYPAKILNDPTGVFLAGCGAWDLLMANMSSAIGMNNAVSGIKWEGLYPTGGAMPTGDALARLKKLEPAFTPFTFGDNVNMYYDAGASYVAPSLPNMGGDGIYATSAPGTTHSAFGALNTFIQHFGASNDMSGLASRLNLAKDLLTIAKGIGDSNVLKANELGEITTFQKWWTEEAEELTSVGTEPSGVVIFNEPDPSIGIVRNVFNGVDGLADPNLDDPNLLAIIAAFSDASLENLDSTIFPAAHMQFLGTNTVFSSVYARFVLNAYDQICKEATKLGQEVSIENLKSKRAGLVQIWQTKVQAGQNFAIKEGELEQATYATKANVAISEAQVSTQAQIAAFNAKVTYRDHAQTRYLEASKAAADRLMKSEMVNLEQRLTAVKTEAEFQELCAKLLFTGTQIYVSDAANVAKMQYAADVAKARWHLDNLRYYEESMASLNGGVQTQKSHAESGFAAMSGFEKAVAIGSAAVSIGGGVAGFLKNVFGG